MRKRLEHVANFGSGYGFSIEDFPDVYDQILDELEKRVVSIEGLYQVHKIMTQTEIEKGGFRC